MSLARAFELERLQTTVGREVIAGLTTFPGMAFVALVDPSILADAGLDRGAAFVATCPAAAIGSATMGLLANCPIALAPSMGLNAYLAYTVLHGLGFFWRVGLAAVLLSGCIFLLLSMLRVREWIIHAIPISLKPAISAGIGSDLIARVGIKALSGRWRDLEPAVVVVAAPFVLKWAR